MSYTKGQWRELVDTIANTPVIMDDCGRTLAKLWDGSYEEKRANARLITAAPVMYSTLKDVLSLADAPLITRQMLCRRIELFIEAIEVD